MEQLIYKSIVDDGFSSHDGIRLQPKVSGRDHQFQKISCQ